MKFGDLLRETLNVDCDEVWENERTRPVFVSYVDHSERRQAPASLYLEELIRADYETEEVTQLAEKIRNGLGCWLTFVTEPEVDSTNNRSERALRKQVVMQKIFGKPETGVRIPEMLSTMVATWERQGLDPSDQLASVLGEERPESRAEVSTKGAR